MSVNILSSTQRRLFFRIAALFNFSVGGVFILAYPQVQELLGLPATPSGLMVFRDLFFGLVIACGVAYWLLGENYARYRMYAPLGAALKLIVVAVVLGHCLAGHNTPALFVLSLGDVFFAIAFMWIFIRTSPEVA